LVQDGAKGDKSDEYFIERTYHVGNSIEEIDPVLFGKRAAMNDGFELQVDLLESSARMLDRATEHAAEVMD